MKASIFVDGLGFVHRALDGFRRLEFSETAEAAEDFSGSAALAMSRVASAMDAERSVWPLLLMAPYEVRDSCFAFMPGMGFAIVHAVDPCFIGWSNSPLMASTMSEERFREFWIGMECAKGKSSLVGCSIIEFF